MKPVFEPDHLAILALTRDLCAPKQGVYLVGGAVRDALLGRSLHDMDFVMGDNPTQLAKRLARRLEAGFFVLDDERHTARVVYKDQQGRNFPLDFVQFTGSDLDEDLQNRDFTINAMAVSVEALSQVIDPLGGQDDLELGLLRLCSAQALLDDPVRVLRGVRLGMQLGFSFIPGLKSAMQAAATQLVQTSVERQRDEFFRLLAGPDPAEGLRLYQQVGVFPMLIPALMAWENIPAPKPGPTPNLEHPIRTVECYHHLLNTLTTGEIPAGDETWLMEDVLSALGKFSGQLNVYINEEITPGRTKATLAYLGALLHELGKPLLVEPEIDAPGQEKYQTRVDAEQAYESAKNLALSNAESGFIQTLVQYHSLLMPLGIGDKMPDRRSIYRFFRSTGEVGVAIALFTLADVLATNGEPLDPKRWKSIVSIVEAILSAWWNDQESIVAPVPLLDGDDLQAIFRLTPGKRIGRLLDLLVEEQASGNIDSIDAAREFVKGYLSDHI